MVKVSVNPRFLTVAIALVGLVVAVAWVGGASRALSASTTPVVYVATGENFPDALGAGPAAAMLRGPVLLVSKNSIPSETAKELSRLAPDKIIIVGGTAVVSPSVAIGLKAYAGTVERIAGANRYDTAARISASIFPVAAGLSGGDAGTLDGLDSSAFALAGHDHDADYLSIDGKAVDADKLDGLDSSAFALAGHDHDADYLSIDGKAVDADKLDGLDSSAFVRQSDVVVPIVEFDGGEIDRYWTIAKGNSVTLSSITLNLPADGTLVANSSVLVGEPTAGDVVVCSITIDGTGDTYSEQYWQCATEDAYFGYLSGTRGFDVFGPQALTVELKCGVSNSNTSPDTDLRHPMLTVIYVPNP